MGSDPGETFRFGVFLLEASSGDLKRDGVPVKIQGQPLNVLLTLVERPGEVVTREELRARLWPHDVFVSFELNLNRAVNKLRETLGDSAENPRFIQTVPRKGYRFIAPVERLNRREETVQSAHPTATPAPQNMGPVPHPASSTASELAPSQAPGTRLWVTVAVIFAISLAMLIYGVFRTRYPVSANPHALAIAALPFRNGSPESHELDFLSDALPSEITTSLNRYPSVAVRPFSTSSRFSFNDIDTAARQLHSQIIISGEYLNAGGTLRVNIEAVDSSKNQIIWRNDIAVETGDWIELRDQINANIRGGLMPALGVTLTASAETHPANKDAYALYLQALALPHDGDGNATAISMLERSVASDHSFGPAWQALGARYHFEYDYSRGGQTAWDEAERAYEQALSLDAQLIPAAASLVMMRTEQGRLGPAFGEAKWLLERHPENGVAHFVMSYVLRYAGELKSSASECDAALAADPTNAMFRTCSQTFIRLGQYSRAEQFIQLDGASNWAQGMLLQIGIRRGDIANVLRQVKPMSEMAAPLVRACALHHPSSEIEELKKREENFPTADPEGTFHVGVVEAYCGFTSDALHWLIEAAKKNYCPADDLETDPVLRRLHGSDRFSELSEASKECRQRFVTKAFTH